MSVFSVSASLVRGTPPEVGQNWSEGPEKMGIKVGIKVGIKMGIKMGQNNFAILVPTEFSGMRHNNKAILRDPCYRNST